MAEENLHMGLMNLHDAFLNASLQRHNMLNSPVVSDPDLFGSSDRGRFERAWAALLYVLVECWRSKQMAPVRQYVASVTDVNELSTILAEGDQNGSIKKLQEVRHYMCHRDNRKYWDQGRLAVLLQLQYNNRLHMAFSKVLLTAMNAKLSNQGVQGPAAGAGALDA